MGRENRAQLHSGARPGSAWLLLSPVLTHFLQASAHWGLCLLSSVFCRVRNKMQQAECWFERPESCLEPVGCDFGLRVCLDLAIFLGYR